MTVSIMTECGQTIWEGITRYQIKGWLFPRIFLYEGEELKGDAPYRNSIIMFSEDELMDYEGEQSTDE